MKITHIYDNGGKTFDRYTIYLDYKETSENFACLGLSSNPDSPQGFSQWCHGKPGRHNGHQIKFAELPGNVQAHVQRRLGE